MNKIFKILIGIVFAAIILLIVFIIFFPFAYRMPKFPEQPKYSIAEKLFLEKLKKKYHCAEINRSYYNITAKESLNDRKHLNAVTLLIEREVGRRKSFQRSYTSRRRKN